MPGLTDQLLGPLPVVPTLPQLPGGTIAMPAAQTAPAGAPPDDFPTIAGENPWQNLDALKLRQFKPKATGDDEGVLDLEDFPIPSSPNQGTPGDDAMTGPMFGHGVRQASLTTGSRDEPRATSRGPSADLHGTITSAAAEGGISPAYALATAERESSFNPDAGGTGSIRGLFQMSGALRRKYGVPEGADAATQARGFAAFTRDLRQEMAGVLRRDPTDAETYLGHHFGGARAARMLSGQISPDTDVRDVFTPNELAGNPHIRRAGTIGNLVGSVRGDMDRRIKRYAGAGTDFSAFGGDGSTATDFSAFGRGENEPSQADKNFDRNKAWTKPGAKDFSTDLGDKEPAFRKWAADNKVPFDPDSKEPSDYDMRGFWKALQAGDARAKSAIDPNDKQLHYPDYWKTPYHETFSNESQWAVPNAPKWNDKDQLVGPDGNVLFDDRARNQAPDVDLKGNSLPGTEIDLSQFGIGT